MQHFLFTDGGSRGNPGPGAGAAVLMTHTLEVIDFTGKYFPVTTNNNAEYQALLVGLKMAAKNACSDLICKLDSELVVKQLNGEYKIKDPNIKNIIARIQEQLLSFKTAKFVHIPREQNKLADKLVNLILDTKADDL